MFLAFFLLTVQLLPKRVHWQKLSFVLGIEAVRGGTVEPAFHFVRVLAAREQNGRQEKGEAPKSSKQIIPPSLGCVFKTTSHGFPKSAWGSFREENEIPLTACKFPFLRSGQVAEKRESSEQGVGGWRGE